MIEIDYLAVKCEVTVLKISLFIYIRIRDIIVASHYTDIFDLPSWGHTETLPCFKGVFLRQNFAVRLLPNQDQHLLLLSYGLHKLSLGSPLQISIRSDVPLNSGTCGSQFRSFFCFTQQMGKLNQKTNRIARFCYLLLKANRSQGR